MAHNPSERIKLQQFSNREVIIALIVAGLVNLATLITFAVTFYNHQSAGAPNLLDAFRAFTSLL